MRVKLNDDILFPKVLHMEPYMVDIKIMEQMNIQKKNETVDNIENENDIQKEIDQLKLYKSGKIWYELYAILIHSGNASFGHYYAYIKNFADAKWYEDI